MDDENVIEAPETGTEVLDLEILEKEVEIKEEPEEITGTEEEQLQEEDVEAATDVPTVSGGDSVTNSGGGSVSGIVGIDTEVLREIKYLLEENNKLMGEYRQEQQVTIWEKDINDYTPVEGMLLIIMVFAVIYFLYKVIGGVLRVKPFE